MENSPSVYVHFVPSSLNPRIGSAAMAEVATSMSRGTGAIAAKRVRRSIGVGESGVNDLEVRLRQFPKRRWHQFSRFLRVSGHTSPLLLVRMLILVWSP